MRWLTKLFTKQSGTKSENNQPMFPVWLEQQGNLSVQDGLDQYIDQFLSLEPIDLASSRSRTIEQRQKELAVMEAEVMLLEQCRSFYGQDSLSAEFNDLLSSKALALQAAKDSLEMKLGRERLVSEALERIKSKEQSQ